MLIDPVALAQALIRLDTTSPPGREEKCAAHLQPVLERHGFAVTRCDFAADRTSLVARYPGSDGALAPLVLTGHLDTVPLGARPWAADPFGAEIRDGRLFGRGASDMKAGVAAAVAAAIEAASGQVRRGIVLVLTSGEETGCRGALHLAATGALGAASGLIVAEPTTNGLAIAHKGALHLRARTAGRTAHGSMPQLGDNAVAKAARAIMAAGRFDLGQASHPLLGPATLTVTTVQGGENVNSVPDACSFTLDIRTLPGMDHRELCERLCVALGPEVTLDPPLADLPAVGTAPSDAFVQHFARVVEARIGKAAAEPVGMPYFTDASALQPAYGHCPTVIFGPGDPGKAHQTDESCDVGRIAEAAGVYAEFLRECCCAAPTGSNT